MEQQSGEPEGEPQLDEYAQVEIAQHKLPEGFFATSKQMFAQIFSNTVSVRSEEKDWG